MPDPVEHLSIYPGGHTDWREEPCDECEEHRVRNRAKIKAGPTVIPPHGTSSTNPTVEEFWATGDPEVFQRRSNS